MTDPAGNVTRTRFAYNDLTGRVERTVTNFVDGAYDSGQPDTDQQFTPTHTGPNLAYTVNSNTTAG